MFNNKKDYPLFSYSTDGNLVGVKKVLEVSKEDINKLGDLNYTSLAIASARGYLAVVEALLANGADPNPRDHKGNTPLHYTGEYNCLEIAKVLLSNGGDLNISNQFGNQPLWVAVFNVRDEESRYELVNLFLEYGADPNHKNNAGMSPLAFAAQVENEKLINLLKKTTTTI